MKLEYSEKTCGFWTFLTYFLFCFSYRSIISPKLFGKPKRALPPKCKLSFLESAGTDIPTIPSERTIAVQNDIARDEHVNTDELNIDSSCDSLVKSVDVTTESSCDENVNTDNDVIDLSCDSLVKADEEVAAINYIWWAYDEHVNTDNEPTDVSCDSHMNNDDVPTDPTHDRHVSSDGGSTTTSVENLPAFIKIPPNKLEVCEIECGKIGLIVDPEYWDWLDLRNSSQENFTSDDGGTASTGIESGHGYDVDFDVDSKASSHSSCHSPVPKAVSCLSCGSDGEPVNSDDGDVGRFNHTPSGNSAYDELFESDLDYGYINSGNYGDFYLTPSPTNSDHAEQPEWTLEYGDLDSCNHTPSNGYGSSVNYGRESLNSNLDDCDMSRESYEELTSAFSAVLRNFVNNLGLC